ncbi:MAG: M56 family metallopeptidase [Dyadobacter sp.]|uniref:M56 family metallopeptidase n=1 Tax=Dyadobacter sp. TaxID=1914288 RepID=UPI00326716C7
MLFDIISQSFVQKFIHAICLTLMHSLWQGLFVAVFAGLILLLTKKSSPALRYNLLSFLLFAFVIVNGVTFAWEFNAHNLLGKTESGLIWLINKSEVPTVTGDHYLLTKAEESSWITSITAFCNANASIIVTVWLLVFSIKSMQAAAGLIYIQKVKNTKVNEVAEHWGLRFSTLCKRLRISQPARLMESARISVPIVIGILKPVVLLPVGMVANLSSAQVEAIILHELAHIKRRDYLVNLLQVCCENVFFFNPAVLWLSYLIRDEREHCCDDLAMSVTGDKTSFVDALVSFQEYNMAGSGFEMAFSKKRNHLLDRIKRIIYNNNKPLNAMEKLFVTFSLVTAVALSAAVSQAVPVKEMTAVFRQEKPEIISPAPEKSNVVVAALDTLPKKKERSSNTEIHSANIYSNEEGVSTYHVHSNDKEYELVQKNGKTTSLKVDGKQIPEREMASYQPEIGKIIAEIKVEHEKAEIERGKADKMRAEADVQRDRADLQRKKADEQRAQADAARGQAEKMRDEAEQHRRDADKHRAEADAHRTEADKHRAEAEVHRTEANVHRKEADKHRQDYEKMQTGMINDLIEGGVVKDKANLSYKLSPEELIVNGVKQSADLHKKLKSKYIKETAVEMVYNFRSGSGYTSTGLIYTK